MYNWEFAVLWAPREQTMSKSGRAIVDSTPSPGHVARFLKQEYRLSGKVDCRLLAKRRACLYEAQAGARRFLFKLLPIGESSPQELGAQLGVLQHARKKGVPIQTALATRRGPRFTRFRAGEGTRFGILFTWMPGVYPDHGKGWSRPLRRTYGQLVGQFQRAAQDLPGDLPLTVLDLDLLIDRSLRSLQPWVRPLPGVFARFKKSAAWARAELAKLPRNSSTWGIVHGDTHGGNIQVQGKHMQLIDTEQVAYGWRIYDVATYFWGHSFALSWGGKLDAKLRPKNLDIFLRAYEKIRPLSQAERRAIPAMMIARNLWLTQMYCVWAGLFGQEIFSQLKYFKNAIRYEEGIRRKRAYFIGKTD